MDLPQVKKRKRFRPKTLVLEQFAKVQIGFIHRRHGLIAKIKTAIATAWNTSKLRYAVYELTKNKRRTP